MRLKVSKKIKSENRVTGTNSRCFRMRIGSIKKIFRNSFVSSKSDGFNSAWNYVLLVFLVVTLFGVLIKDLTYLQIVQGEEFLNQSENNQVSVETETAYRGAILDRDGNILAQNVSSMNVYISVEDYIDDSGYIDSSLLQKTSDTLMGILGDKWNGDSESSDNKYTSISEKVYTVYMESPYFMEILVASDIDDELAIKIKSLSNELPGVYIDNGSKRYYPEKNVISYILGYTGEVTADDLDSLQYVTSTDVVGRTGIEREYDEKLLGEHGEIAWEVDALGRKISDEGYIVKEAVAGDNLYLTIDIDAQKKLYDVVANAVSEYGATGAAAIVEDVTNGELLSIVSYPSYDNNLFIGGISYDEYSAILNDPANPLLNRAIAAQVPPGSTFKTLVAASALEAGAVTKGTVYVSRRGYTFTSGASFQEYNNNAYGSLNLVDALSVSSNIYFCELIRNWNMDSLVPYLEKFGIGRYTGIDIPGEAAGRLPSPENKVLLANTTSPWLDSVWYPEGDSCNSVIGQGITLVTPLQMANWTSAIANGGTLYTPHVGKYFKDTNGEIEYINFDHLEDNVVSDSSLSVVREGMWSAVNGSRATISLRDIGVTVAAKTGTAEFGSLNEKGEYEHTHAWVTSFFPYDNPKYALTIFLEDGGQSYNAVKTAKEMIVWLNENGFL